MEVLKIYVLFIVFLPLIASLIVGLNCRIVSNRFSHIITSGMVFVSSLISLKVLYLYSLCGYEPYNETLYIWGNFYNFKLEIGFLVDRLTSIMMFVVTFISFLVHVYTIGYMHGDKGYNRFFSYISFFTFSMLMLVVSNNFLQLFFGWEAVGLASYLLIGFWFNRDTAVFANLKAFIVNRVGDLGFLLGISAIFCCFGTLNYIDVFSSVKDVALNGSVIFDTIIPCNFTTITFISICLFIGAMGKSAQVPLHVWLPDSMEGPTPISALIHAATMVTAGIFMVARMSPIFEYSYFALSFVFFVGVVTCFFMGLLGLVQNDIKRIVAYSTLSQLGLMVTALGVSAYSAAIFHLFTHAFFKALLFLGSGSVIIAMHHEQDIKNMGNLRKYMPITYYTMLLGSLALAGFPGFSGFFSKDLIIDSVKYSGVPYSDVVYYVLLCGIFVTSLYTFRLFFLVFHTEERFDEHTAHNIVESPYVVTIPLIVLAIFSVISGWLFFDSIINDYFKDSIFVDKNVNVNSIILEHLKDSKHLFFHSFLSLPFFVSVLGIISAWFLYCYKKDLIVNIKNNFSVIYFVLINKYGFDSFNQYVLAYSVKGFGNFLWKFGDMLFIDKILVNGSAFFIKYLSIFINSIQTGRLYNYIYIMITGFTVLLSWLIFKFA